MSMVQLGDFIFAILAEYMLANLMCKINKRKYRYMTHMLLSLTFLSGLYFLIQYGIHSVSKRVVVGIIAFIIHHLLLFDGTKESRIWGALLVYGIYIGLDAVCLIIYSPWMFLTSSDLTVTSKVLLGRNLYSCTFYLFLMIFEWVTTKKESTQLKKITFLSILLAISQIFSIYSLCQSNSHAVMEHIILMSVFYSGMVILGYFITMEMFHQIINQQKKQNELEQQSLEKKYQYEYFLLSCQQGERIRNFRHDMRNQLQTVQYLMDLEGEEERERAKRMLSHLLEKINEGYGAKRGDSYE